ncbi:MAG: hypothetical protein ACREDL_16350, partial [Bradyrhizobium sp.]
YAHEFWTFLPPSGDLARGGICVQRPRSGAAECKSAGSNLFGPASGKLPPPLGYKLGGSGASRSGAF